MKKIQIAAGLLAFLLADVAAAPSCPGGGGYWDYEERQVRVCDYITETYTESNRHCGYSGRIDLSVNDYLWYPPVHATDYSMHASSTLVLAVTSSCPASDFKTAFQTYWARSYNNYNETSFRSGWYSGSIPLISDRVDTQTKTRTVETNCRTETKTVRVWRCGMIP
ncbi:MAG TPA: hypothetical protein DF774_04165 [Rheinheimera sp.]|uniref:hypothetical protein n=1 Tax=Rheinheimera sp. TaxID=1869214 RepID=UPI000EBF19BF|nr:hypothetical protein [Rheinheimera sp.]HCU64936.1 hypothetical protein [Rheinheimera sp.]